MSRAIRVVTYHRVSIDHAEDPELDPLLVSATSRSFRTQMLHLKRWYRPVALSDLVDTFAGGRSLPARAVHVTFDDAYTDFAATAWPTLRELGIPVTLFVPTAYPGRPSRRFWWDRLHVARMEGLGDAWIRDLLDATPAGPLPESEAALDPRFQRSSIRALEHDEAERWVDRAWLDAGLDPVAASPTPVVLDWDEIRTLVAEGVSIGAHTRSHAALSRADPDRVRAEIRGSLDDIEREVGQRPRVIAYPYGRSDSVVERIAHEEGCLLGFTCEDGLNRPGSTDPMRLRRTNITRRTSGPLFMLRMLPWFARVDRWRHRGERR